MFADKQDENLKDAAEDLCDEHGHSGHGHHDHCPHHHHGHAHHHEVSGNIAVAFFLNLAFSMLEFVGGFFVNSIAIVSDAVHDLGDAMVIGTSFVLERKSTKDPDASHSYGYRRYSTVGAMITTCVLIAGAVLVVVNAVPRLFDPEPANYDGMIAFAVFGLAVNGFAAWKTSGGESLNQRAVSLHMLEDVLGWAAVLVGAVVMRFSGWAIIDPVMSIAIAAFIGYNAFDNLRSAMPIFMERVPAGFDADGMMSELPEAVEGLEGIHHVHVWGLDEDTVLATMHAVVAEEHDMTVVKNQLKTELERRGISHSTIEVEQHGEPCPDIDGSCSYLSNVAGHDGHVAEKH